MNKELIHRLAREAMTVEEMMDAADLAYLDPADMKRFAALVAERCAEVVVSTCGLGGDLWSEKCVAAIRAEFPKP